MSDWSRYTDPATQLYGLPPGLLNSMVMRESSGDPNAVSRAGAQGLLQLMPGTAKDMGVRNSFDPAQNIDGGARYLRKLLDKTNGDIPLSLAMWNFGPGNVASGKPLPQETKDFQSRVMGDIGAQGGGAGSGGLSTLVAGAAMPAMAAAMQQAAPPSQAPPAQGLAAFAGAMPGSGGGASGAMPAPVMQPTGGGTFSPAPTQKLMAGGGGGDPMGLASAGAGVGAAVAGSNPWGIASAVGGAGLQAVGSFISGQQEGKMDKRRFAEEKKQAENANINRLTEMLRAENEKRGNFYMHLAFGGR